MPPIKAGPPPSALQLPPPLIKRKLPEFIRPIAKAAKKRVSFDMPDEPDEPESVKPVKPEPVKPEPVKPEPVQAPWVEKGNGPSQGENDMLEQMYLVFKNLSSECDERKLEARLKMEVSGEPTPPSSQDSVDSLDSNASWEFELAYSTATDYVESSDIFDFIFKYISNHQVDIYRRIGTGLVTREMAEGFLRNAPRDLLQILEIALAEAELTVFSV